MILGTESKYLCPAGHPNRPGYKLYEKRALVIHYTANYAEGANDIANARYFIRPAEWEHNQWENKGTDDKFIFASAHYVVDMDSIQLVIPENEVAWHVGATSYTKFAQQKFTAPNGKCMPNYYTIGIEMCVNKGNDWIKTCDNTADLAADIMIRNNIPMDMVIRHYDVTGKLCPKPFVDDPKAWQDFKALVAKKIAQRKEVKPMEKHAFKDLVNTKGQTHFAAKEIDFLAAKGIVKGDSNGNFNPDAPMTRGQMCAVLYRALKEFGIIKE